MSLITTKNLPKVYTQMGGVTHVRARICILICELPMVRQRVCVCVCVCVARARALSV